LRIPDRKSAGEQLEYWETVLGIAGSGTGKRKYG